MLCFSAVSANAIAVTIHVKALHPVVNDLVPQTNDVQYLNAVVTQQKRRYVPCAGKVAAFQQASDAAC
jgi:hypothetical protein